MAAIASAVGWAWSGVATFLATTAIGQAISQLIIMTAINLALKALSPKPQPGSIDQGQELRIKFDTAYPREVGIGRTATGGSLVYAATSGDENKYLWRVIALSDCEIDAIEEVWANGELLTFDGDWHSEYAECTSHFVGGDGTSRLWVRIYKGTDTQVVDPDLNTAKPGEWTSTCRGRGVAYAIVKKQYDTEAYSRGEPDLFFVGRYCKGIYDPRVDTSYWTDNAALLAAQAMRGVYMNGVRVVGLGASSDDVPNDWLAEAANECDDDIALFVGGTEKRYRANGMISGSESAREIITNLTGAMAGLHIDNGGAIRFMPGVARSPIMSITDNDLLRDAPVSWTGRRTGDELVNCITSRFVDPSIGWQEGALPPRKDETAIAEDGGDRFEASRAYRYVTSNTQGQRLDEIDLRTARKMGRGGFALPLWGLELEPGDWIEWESNRWGGGVKTFYVVSNQLAIAKGDDGQPSARCVLTVQETDATCFDWSTTNETSHALGIVGRTIPPLTLTGLAADGVATSAGGAIMSELEISWTTVTDPAATVVEIEYKIDGDDVVYTAYAAPTTDVIRVRNGIYPDTDYEVRGRMKANERPGPWTNWVSVSTDPDWLVPPDGVDTTSILGNAVTQTAAATTAGSINLSYGPNNWTDIEDVTMTTFGGPIIVSAFCLIEGLLTTSVDIWARWRILRDGSEIIRGYGLKSVLQTFGQASMLIVDQPSAGSHTWTWQAELMKSSGSATGTNAAEARTITVTELKR